MSNISGSLVSIVYNFQLLLFAGENGVAAYGVLMYVQFIFEAIFIGYTIGTGPVVGNYGGGSVCVCNFDRFSGGKEREVSLHITGDF